MKLLIAFIFFLTIFICISKKCNLKKDKMFALIPLLFPIAFDIAFSNVEYRIVGENLKFYINTATIMLFCFFLFISNKKIFTLTLEYVFFIPLFLNISTQLIFYEDLIGSGPMFNRLTLNYLTIYLCLLIVLSLKRIPLKEFLYNFNYLAIFNGILSILQMLTGKKLLIGSFSQSIIYTEGITDTYRAVGIAGSNNSAGNLSLLLFTIVLINVIKYRDKVSIISLFFTLIFAVLTQTRIALLAIGIVSVIVFILVPIQKKKKIYISLSVIGLFTTIAFIFYNRIIETLFLSRGNTANQRFIQYERAFNKGIFEHPFLGIGTGQWRSYLYRNYEIVDIPIHSQAYNFFVENGIFVFISFLLFNIFIIMKILNNKELDNNSKILGISLFVGNFLVSNFNPNQVYTINNAVYYLVIFSLVYFKENDSYKNSKFKDEGGLK